MKKGIGPQGLGSPAKMYKSPAKKFELIMKRKEDGTANPESIKADQTAENNKSINKSHRTNFGVKKPKVNIK